MKRFVKYIKQLSLDQKKYYGIGFVGIGILLVYAISHVSDHAAVRVEQAKNSDFKNGNLTTDQTSEFYREKNLRAQSQNERILQHLKDVDERMSELAKRFETKDPPLDPTKNAPLTPAPQVDQARGVAEVTDGKKIFRRGQNQSRIKFHLVMPKAEILSQLSAAAA